MMDQNTINILTAVGIGSIVAAIITLAGSLITSIIGFCGTLIVIHLNNIELKKQRQNEFNKELYKNIEEKIENVLQEIDEFSVNFAQIHNSTLADFAYLDPNEHPLTIWNNFTKKYFKLRKIYIILSMYFNGNTSAEKYLLTIREYLDYFNTLTEGRDLPLILTDDEKNKLKELFNAYLNLEEELIRETKYNLLVARKKFYDSIL